MNVLSLFGGIETGLIALKELGVKIDNYYSSEIDKYACSVSRYLHSEIKELGDVSDYRIWDLPKIDLILAGPPCQGFSIAGKGLNWDDPRSQLFFIAIEILWDIQKQNPKVKFLFENVASMKKSIIKEINELMEVDHIMINSALVSAQNRKRNYWFNWDVEQPKDKGILLKDIIICGSNQLNQRPRGNNSGGLRENKTPSMNASSWVDNVHVLHPIIYQFPHGCSKGGVRSLEKMPTVSAQFHNNHFPVDFNKLVLSEKAIEYMDRKIKDGRTHWDFSHHLDIRNKKSSAIVANFLKGVPYNVLKDWDVIRKFHPVECERLQTLPDGSTSQGTNEKRELVKISATQQYKMIGNGWTKDVIKHMLKGVL